MKLKEILNILLCGVVIVAGGYLVIRLVKWLIGMVLGGASILLVFLYAFAPIIIIVLLVMILIRMGRK